MIKSIKQLLDWIYHRVCYFCKKSSTTGLMCQKCFEKVEINFLEPIKTINNVKIYSISSYENEIKKLIRGLKYHKKKDLALYMAKFMYTYWQNIDENIENIEIIPMPLHPLREKKRGYNHVYLIAKEFSKLTGYPVNLEIVKRVKNTKPQYEMKSIKERRENLKGAFKINPEKYKGQKLLLIDDICTSGTTLKELINTFKRHNITNLCAIVGSNPIGSSESH